MAEIKKINTEFQLLDKLLDTSGDAGTSGQVLSSTATGINWVSGSNLPGGPYLPLTGGTMTGNTNHIDGIIANFGNSNDLQIYHDGSNSYIKEIGTGNLRIRSTSLRLEGTDSSNMVVANQGGSVSLYYNASKKFETSNGGVSVTGDGIFTGNVGIGTTSPSEKLDVEGNVRVGVNNGFYINNQNVGIKRTSNDLVLGGFGNVIIRSSSTTVVNQVERMRITSAGNVGIGTSSPQTKLQVEYTDTHTSGDLALANSAFDIYNDSTTDVAGKGSTITFSDNYLGTNKTTRAAIKGGTDTAGNTADGFLAFYTDSSSANSMQQRMIINHDGRVSFNYYGSGSFTGTATQRLAVDTSGNVIEIPIGSGPVDGSGTANYSARWIDTDTLGIGTLYDNGTNVGIGTTSPTHNLHIASDAPVIRLQDNTSSDNHYLNGNNGEFRIQTTGFLTLRPGNTESVRFLANGNVGINETNPTKKLQVNGQTKFYEYSGAHLTNQATSNFNFDTLANNAASTSGGSVGAFIKLTATPPGATSTWSTFRARAYGENTKGNTDGMITFFSEYRNYTSTNAVTLNYHAGLYVNPLGVGGLATVTNNYGVYLNPGTSATNNYGVYQNGSSVKNFFQGNVGIGTTSPAHKLTINASNNTTALGIDFPSAHFDFSASSTSGYTSNFRINDVGMDIGHDSTARSLNLQTGNQDRLTILGTGNVGIGTTSPSEKLDVSGRVLADAFRTDVNTSDYSVISRSSAGNAPLYVQSADSNTNQPIAKFFYGNAAPNQGTIVLNVAKDSTYFSNTNVGIGTTSPGAKLDVVGSVLATLFRVSNTTADATTKYGTFMGRHYTNSEENITGMLLTSSSSVTGGTVSIGGGISSANAVNNIILYTAANNTTLVGTERMRINPSGNVGIGTTSPVNKQQNKYTGVAINSMTATAGTASTNWNRNAGLLIEESNSSNGLALGVSQTANDRKSWIQSGHPGSAANSLGILSLNPLGGNVGIGTTSPSEKLEVSGDIKISRTDSTSSVLTINTNRSFGRDFTITNDGQQPHINATDVLKITADGGVAGIRIDASGQDYISFTTENSERVRINPSGNVGIGTTSPLSKLNVNGDIKIEGENQLYFGSSGSVPLWEIKASGSNLVINDTGSNVGNLIFEGRDFGVGITSPQEKLHVSGETHPSIKLSSSSDSNYNVILNCGFRNEALNLSVGGYKVFTTEGFNTPETTHLYSNNSKALSLASNQAATFTSTVTATNFINSSDERLKENIKKVCNNTLDVKWKTFEFKSDKGQKRYGVIAQELEKTNPEFVREDAEGFKSVAYIDLLIAKIAELEERIQTLENK